MRSIISKGKTVKEALKLGLEILNVPEKNVNIKIIQPEARSFLWFKRKQAVIELEVNEEKEELERKREEVAKEDICVDRKVEEIQKNEEKGKAEGKAWTKNGMLYAQPTSEIIPIATLASGIKLVRGKKILQGQTIPLYESGEYKLIVETEEVKTDWNLTIDKHKLKATLHVTPGYTIIRTVPDYKPVKSLKIKLTEKKLIKNTLKKQDIIKKMEELHIIYGINQAEIIKATQTLVQGEFEIATGKKVNQGKHGWVESKVKTDVEKGYKENEKGQIDFREIITFPTVEKGFVIANIHAPVKGEVGITVTNELLPAKEPFPIVSELSKEVMLVDNKIVALEDGRPTIERKGQLVKFSILKKLVQNGNVNLATGNIRFNGDVEIKGEVEEKMMVEAEGNICIHQFIHLSTILANGSIITKGSISKSRLAAGKNHIFMNELTTLLQQISTIINTLILLLEQVISSPGFNKEKYNERGIEPLIRTIMAKRYPRFPTIVSKYRSTVKKDPFFTVHSPLNELAESLRKLFLSLSPSIFSINDLRELLMTVKEILELGETPIDENSFIKVPNVFNSYLNSSGNITIYGQGCINSRVYAGGKINISGVLRGGELFAKEGISIYEAGSNSGTATSIMIPENKKIMLNKVLEGTNIIIGNVRYTFKEERTNIVAKLSKDKKIVLNTLK
ncbi:MAG: FapA family protein [Bacillus sp. (in: firmicutes)]